MQNKILEIQNLLKKFDFDAWLVYDFRKANIFAQKVVEIPSNCNQSRRFYYLIPKNGEPKKLVHSIEQWNLDHLPGEKLTYNSWKTLNDGLKNLLQNVKTVAMEYSPMNAIPYVAKVDAGTIELINSVGVKVVTSADLVQHIEACWSSEQSIDQFESAKMLRETVDIAFNFIGDELNKGNRITEYDVQQEMMKNFIKHNHITYAEPNCSINANGANPHYEPTKEINSEIKKGDYVLIDLWAKKNKPKSTYADITWVAYVGSEIPKKYLEVFNVVKGGRDAAIKFIQDEFEKGNKVSGCDVDDAARKYITEKEYGEYFVHRTGHSIGEEVHGNGANIDNFETNDKRELIPNTCFSIEPGVYLPNEFGIRLEVNVFISNEKKVIIPGQPIQNEIVLIKV